MRRNIIDASTLPRHPTAADLKDTVRPPQNRIEFLQHLVSKKTHEKTVKEETVTKFIAEDIFFNVTKGRWTQSKRMLLGMTIRQ